VSVGKKEVIKTGQHEVIEFLKKHPDKWYTLNELSEQVKLSLNSRLMNKLIQRGLVCRKKFVEYVTIETVDGIKLRRKISRYKYKVKRWEDVKECC